MTRARGRRQDRPRRRLPAADHVSRRAHRSGRWRAASRARASVPRRSSWPPPRTPTPIRRPRSGRARSRRVPVSGHLHAASRARPPRQLVARMVDGFEKVLTPELRAAGGGARPERPRARDARVDRREGNRQAGRAAARAAVYCEPAADRHGAAVRSDGHLRARARRAVRRQHHARRSADRLALQHLSVRRTAARPDRRPRPRVARGRRQSRERALPLLRQPQRRLARLRHDARRAQPQRRRVPEEPESNRGRTWNPAEPCRSEPAEPVWNLAESSGTLSTTPGSSSGPAARVDHMRVCVLVTAHGGPHDVAGAARRRDRRLRRRARQLGRAGRAPPKSACRRRS